MTKSLEGRWVKPQRAAAILVGLLLFTQCSQQGPVPADRATTSAKSEALSANQWPLETLTATNSIALEERATLVGDAVVTKQATGAVLAFNAELALGFDAVLTGSVKSDTLVLKDRSVITGTARYNGVTNTGTIQGGGSSPLALPLFTIPALPTVTPGSQDVTLTSSQQQTRAAGAYRDVLLNSGNAGTPTRLTLSGGLYHFKSLTVQNDAGVQCSAACEIRVQGRVAVGDRSFLKPQSGVPGLGVGNVELLIGGTNGAAGPSGWPAALEVNNDGQLRAYTLAPNGTARLGHRVVLQGKVVAGDVLVGFDSDAEGLQLPLISTQPADVTVRENQPASFSVAVSNPAGVTYRWQRGGVDITGTAGAGATYTLAHAPVSADGAQFRVKVTNAAGTVTSNAATLHVIPCAVNDVTCDNFDDDCNGVNDEDFGPKCNLEGGTAVLHCGGGTVFATPCTNGNACDGAEFCQSASCHDGPDLAVDDGNPCTADSCVHPGGVQHQLLPEGTDCGDGNDCNGIDHCTAAGVCETLDPLLSTDPCIVDICDASTGLVWATTPAPEGTLCDDGDVSNDPDFCDGAGTCFAGGVLADDGNPCTLDSFESGQGSIHTPLPAGTECATPGADDFEVCDVRGVCVEREVAREGSRPGNMRPSFGRVLAARRGAGSPAFRSQGFALPGEMDLVAETGNVANLVTPDVNKLLQIWTTDYSDHISGCPLGSVNVYAIATVDGVQHEAVLIHNQVCDFLGCEPTVPLRIGIAGFTFPSTQDSTTIVLRVDENRSETCFTNDGGFSFAPSTYSLDVTAPYTTQPQCMSGFHVDNFCWHVTVDTQLPTPVDPEICFEWGTSFVDEGMGEDIRGAAVDCAMDTDCDSGRCENGACSLEQRYPARFAEVQLKVVGGNGELTLGQHYDAAGTPGAGTPVYLDKNGCLPSGSVPGAFLSPIAGAGEIAVGPFPLRVEARVRSSLRKSAFGYEIRYADDETFEVVEFKVPSTATQFSAAGWTMSDDIPADMVNAGTRVFLPPPRVTLTSTVPAPGTNTSAALGTMLMHPDPTYGNSIMNVQMGSGLEVCPALDSCRFESDCPGPQTCQGVCRGSSVLCEDNAGCPNGTPCDFGLRCSDNQNVLCSIEGQPCEAGAGTCISKSRCRHCYVDSFYNRETKILQVGPAVMEPDAPSCTDMAQCPESQDCLQRDGLPCAAGAECYCSWPDQSSWKYVIAHEAGHQLQNQLAGALGSFYDFDGAPDPAGIAPMCACSHVESANQLHCLQSAETFTSALSEGFGHFMGVKSFNDRDAQGCGFGYYKEVLAPELLPGVATGYCASRPGLCFDYAANPNFKVALPPVPVDCATPFKLRNTFCPSLPSGSTQDVRLLATEHDFLQFFHSVYTQGARINMRDLYSILRTTCSGRQSNCSNPRDPESCTPCPGGLCTEAPCAEGSDLCGARICFAERLDDPTPPSDDLRWAPILASEVDGIDDPLNPIDDDVSAETVSLVDGATRYLGQKYGANSEELEQFIAQGEARGITPDLAP